MGLVEFVEWVTTVEAAKILNRGEGWLRANAASFGIERIKKGNTAFYRRADVDRVAAELKAKEDGG